MKKSFILFVVCILSLTVFSQDLRVVDPGIILPNPLGIGTEQSLQFFAVENISPNGQMMTGIELIIDSPGQMPYTVVPEVRLYKGELLIASENVQKFENIQEIFSNGTSRIQMWADVIIAPREKVVFLIKGEVRVPAKLRIVLSKIFQKKSTTYDIAAFGDVQLSQWRETNPNFITTNMVKIYPEKNRIIAPRSKNVRIGMVVDPPQGKMVFGIDALSHQNMRIMLNAGVEFCGYLQNWNGDLRSRGDENMLIAYGTQGISNENALLHVRIGLNSGKFAEGDRIPFMFNLADVVTDIGKASEHAFPEEGMITIGPDVMFGDPLNVGVVNSANMAYCLKTYFEGYDLSEYDLLKVTLSADVNGNGYIDNDDFYHMLEMAYDKYYTPPILYISGGVGKQLAKSQGNCSIITKEKNGVTEVFLSAQVRSCELKVTAPAGTMIQKGPALNSKFSHIGKRNGKEDLLFATRDGLDISKPILVVSAKSSSIKIEGVVDDGMPIGVNGVNGVGDNNTLAPTEFTLLQNYPNPFNPSTKITYSVPQTEKVELRVYDVLGKEVATVVNEVKTAGKHEVVFNASNIPSGVYFYTIKAGQYCASRKMVIMK